MKNYQSDVLYSVKTQQGMGFIYVLVEHQSKPDKLIAWRLMRYSMAIMQQHLEQGHKTLPLVFPMLFYYGKQSPHPYSTNWLDAKKKAELKLRRKINIHFHDLKAKSISDFEGSSKDKQMFSGHKTESQVLVYDRKVKKSPSLNREKVTK